MAHEEHSPMCNHSSVRLSKKSKNKKVPQRGMGVAQLEKIISQEEQSINFTPPASIPLPPPLPPNHRPLIQITDVTNPGFVHKPMHTSRDGGRLQNGGDRLFVGENPIQKRRLDHRAYANLSGIQYESNRSIWRSIPTNTTTQLYLQPCSSSMGNLSLGTTSTSSSSTSSVVNYQMELPSNQNYCSNNNYSPPLWPHGEKMVVGMKRPYPFSMDNISIPPVHFKFPLSQISRSNESASCSNGVTTSFDPPNPVCRENASNLITKDFLNLGPLRESRSKEKLSPLTVGESTSQQGQTRDPSGSDLSNGQQLYSFFPTVGNNGEEGENVDLNLKL